MSDKKSKASMHWDVQSSKEIFNSGMFQLRADQCRLPDGRVMPNYYVFSFESWVQVIPVTRENEVIMVRQYRHAIKATTLEFPGGATHGYEKDEVQKSALRELQEETGYSSQKLSLIGQHHPNPALQNNYLFTYLALDCKKVSGQNLDPFEDIEVVLVPLKDLAPKVYSGEISHSLVVASLFYALPHLGLTLPS